MSQNSNENSLLSSTTILILSGLTLGIAFQDFLNEELLPYLIAVGVSGILVYLILDIAASRRALADLEAEREHVEDRLDKHMFSLTNYGFTLPEKDELSSKATQSSEVDIESEQLVSSA